MSRFRFFCLHFVIVDGKHYIFQRTWACFSIFLLRKKLLRNFSMHLKKKRCCFFGPVLRVENSAIDSLLLILLSLLSLLLHFKLLLKSCIQPVPSTQGHRHVRLETLQSHKMIFLPSENKECVQHRHVTTAVQCFDGVVVLFW